MPTEADVVAQMQQDIARFVRQMVGNQYTADAVTDATVTIATDGGPRTISRLRNTIIQPGDQVLVMRLGAGEVAVGAVAADIAPNLTPAGVLFPPDVIPLRASVASYATTDIVTHQTAATASTALAEGQWGLWLSASGQFRRSVATGSIEARINSDLGTSNMTANQTNNGDLAATAHTLNLSQVGTLVIPPGGATQNVHLQVRGGFTAGTTTVYNALLTGFWHRIG